MALKKEIELNNGVIVTYHRIVSIIKITNHSNLIEVASYISEKKRQEEIDYYNNKKNDKKINIFINTSYFEKKYNENENIEEIYSYLKTLDVFKNSENV